MGGQLEYFGLWLSAEYGDGSCSKSCTTYSCPQLTTKECFKIDHLEVWGIGPEPKLNDDEVNPQAIVLLVTKFTMTKCVLMTVMFDYQFFPTRFT